VDTVAVSFTAVMGQMTEMSPRQKSVPQACTKTAILFLLK